MNATFLSGVEGIVYKDGVLYRVSSTGREPVVFTPGITETDPVFTASPAAAITTSNISNWNSAYSWGNHASAGYLTSETDPTVPGHVKAITTTNVSNWNTAYSWGNHATAGYLTATPTLNQVTTTGATTTNSITIGGLTVATNLIYTDTVNGRVGIKTLTPGVELDVIGNIRSNSTVFTSLTATQSIRPNSITYLRFLNSAGTTDVGRYYDTGNWVIQNGGTFTDAGYRLDVQGNTRILGTLELGTQSAVQGGLTLSQKYSGANILGSISSEYASGAMILGYGVKGKTGVAGFVSSYDNFSGYKTALRIGSQGTLSFFSSITTNLTPVGSDLSLTEVFKIDNTGYVGIGTTNPTKSLTVNGDISIPNKAAYRDWETDRKSVV